MSAFVRRQPRWRCTASAGGANELVASPRSRGGGCPLAGCADTPKSGAQPDKGGHGDIPSGEVRELQLPWGRFQDDR